MGKLTEFIAGAVLMAGMGGVNAGEAPEILGAADYQAMSTSAMSNITGESVANINTNVNIAVCTPPTSICETFSSSISITEESDGGSVNTTINVNIASASSSSQ